MTYLLAYFPALCCVCQEDIKTLITYLVEKHFAAFEGVTYVQTFKALRQRYDQRAERSVIADRLLPLPSLLLLFSLARFVAANSFHMPEKSLCQKLAQS